MAENVLKRRDEYFDKKAKIKSAGSAVPAIVAASVMVVVMLFGTIIGSVMRNPTPPAASSLEATDTMVDKTETETDYVNIQELEIKRYQTIMSIKSDYPDVFGWIDVSGTDISYIVMQGKETNTEYLYTEYNGNYTRYGSVFADWRNSKNIIDNKNTVIYGQDIMFTQLNKLADNEEAFKDNDIKIMTSEGLYKYRAFSVYYADSGNIVDDSIKTDFSSDEAFIDFCKSCGKKSLFKTDTAFTADSRIVSLVSLNGMKYKMIIHAALTDVSYFDSDDKEFESESATERIETQHGQDSEAPEIEYKL